MLDSMKRTIRDRHLLVHREKVLVALSGGPDSVALVHLLARLRKPMKLTLRAVHINHLIRPRASKREEAFCRDLCRRLRVPLTVIQEDIPARAQSERKGLEETARDFRYQMFEEVARQYACDKVALGHHADDRAETVLFHVLRGTGLRGLIGIPPQRGIFVRPLIDTTKTEILDFLKREDIAYCEDASNKGTDASRNYIRNRLLVSIRKRLNPAVDRALLNLSDLVAEEERFLHDMVIQASHRAVSWTPGGKIELDLQRLASYNTWLQRRLLRYCVARLSVPEMGPDRNTVARLERMVMGKRGRQSLPGQLEVSTVGQKLVFFKRPSHHYAVSLSPGRRQPLPGLGLGVTYRTGHLRPERLKKQRRSQQVVLDLNKVTLPLLARSIRPGDRFVPLGMSGSKKVADYLIDRKLDRVYRDEVPVVCDQEGVVWLVGYEIADRVKVDETTKRIITIGVRRLDIHAPPTV